MTLLVYIDIDTHVTNGLITG